MQKPYVKKQFRLVLDGTDQPLTLKGIFTSHLLIQADHSNFGPVYVGNVFDCGDGRTPTPTLKSPLAVDNNIEILEAGQGADYTDNEQFDRLPRTRNWYLERGRLYILSEWYVRGTAGDVVFVTWWDGGEEFVDIDTKETIDTSNDALSRGGC